jgi:hypothetical protein
MQDRHGARRNGHRHQQSWDAEPTGARAAGRSVVSHRIAPVVRPGVRPAGYAAVVLALSGLLAGEEAQAQATPARLPFAIGEELIYRASSNRFGHLGRGAMRVEGPEEVRGQETYVLGFDFHGRLGPVALGDRTRSWIVPRRMAALRYRKRERAPLLSRGEEVELYPAEQRWESANGDEGRTPSDAPLDELSFLYFVRTLPLADGDVYTLNRHFDPDRNPVTVRVIHRERLAVPAGDFPTVMVEMRVQDRRRFRGTGVIRIHLTDDDSRMPVRIESSFPLIGQVTLLLESGSIQRHAGPPPAGANVSYGNRH